MQSIVEIDQDVVERLEEEAGMLTDGEREVLRLLATDLTKAQVAERLGISRPTLDMRLQKVKNRLGVRSIMAIVVHLAVIEERARHRRGILTHF